MRPGKVCLFFIIDKYGYLISRFQVDNVTDILGDKFNAGGGNTPNRTQYRVVADPMGNEINQAWFNLHFSDHNFKLGRQRIVFDNQRFIGGVAWRQKRTNLRRGPCRF